MPFVGGPHLMAHLGGWDNKTQAPELPTESLRQLSLLYCTSTSLSTWSASCLTLTVVCRPQVYTLKNRINQMKSATLSQSPSLKEPNLQHSPWWPHFNKSTACLRKAYTQQKIIGLNPTWITNFTQRKALFKEQGWKPHLQKDRSPQTTSYTFLVDRGSGPSLRPHRGREDHIKCWETQGK